MSRKKNNWEFIHDKILFKFSFSMKECYQFPKDGYIEYEETKEIYLCVA